VPRIDIPDVKGDPEVRVWALRPEMGVAAGALSHAIYEQSVLPVRERELARMRIAQINGCVICQQWRSTPGAEGHVEEADYADVSAWKVSARFTERERLAIEYAELFATAHDQIDDAFFTRHLDFYRGEMTQLTDPARQEKTRASADAQNTKTALKQGSRNLKVLSDAGVPIALGTDSGANLGQWQGYFEHTELEMMVQAGMTPMQALVAACTPAVGGRSHGGVAPTRLGEEHPAQPAHQ